MLHLKPWWWIECPLSNRTLDHAAVTKGFPSGGKESPSRDRSGQGVMLFMRTLGKLLFPRLPHDQRRKRMNTIIGVVLVVLVFGGIVGAVIYFSNRH